MDEARQRRPPSDAPSIPLEVLSGLGIDISSANMSSQEMDDHSAPLHNTTTPDSAQHCISPPSTGGLSGSTQAGQSPANLFSPEANKPFSRHSTSYSASIAHQSLPEDPEANLLRKHHSASLYSAYGDFAANHKCESVKGVKGSRRNWLSVVTILLALYSTIFSGIFVIIALVSPKWHMIGTNGRLNPSSAALITTILAKTIEMSFVTVIIAMIGQDLSRRASSTNRSGVTLAELNMRSWIMQPGTMISRWESVKYAGISFLGVVSVLAAVFAMLYTPACSALVQPQLRSSSWEQRNMSGLVLSKFANSHHIKKECFTPIPEGEDQVERSATCLSIEHAAMAYKNYFNYLEMWSGKEVGSNFTDRPNGTAWFSNDTTVIAPWVGLEYDAAFLYLDTGIIVNNVSLAFPHAGVATAARDANNNIAQPEDLDGVGRYTINASVASPLLHSLCATVSEKHLAPLIFEKWNLTNETLNHTTWPAQLKFSNAHPSPYLGGTDLDDIFEWGEKYGDHAWPPVFMRLPQEFNTMVNGTGSTRGQMYGRSSVYILGKGNSTDSDEDPAERLDYFLCQLQVSQTPYCYTSYRASGQGAVLEAACDRSAPTGHTMRYIEGEKDAPSSRVFADRDWPMVASEMALALSLNDGSFEGKSANARLLSQLLLRHPTLDPTRPSLAEALAVLSGCTLLQSTADAPFIHYWKHPTATASLGELSPGVREHFNASLSAQSYTSGGTSPYQRVFHLVLLGVFALNVLALAYFAAHKTWYVDLSEPPNLFSLAVNSPPSEAFAGCCGTGPTGKDYGVAWTLGQEQGHVFVQSGPRREVEGGGGAEGSEGVTRRRGWKGVVAESPLTRGMGTVRSWGRKT